jgi:hypothetical protein
MAFNEHGGVDFEDNNPEEDQYEEYDGDYEEEDTVGARRQAQEENWRTCPNMEVFLGERILDQPVDAIPGVGPATKKKLHALGMRRVS